MVLIAAKLFWFILPAGVANIFASMSRYIVKSEYPVDFYLGFRGKRIFGDHKTWRGVIVGSFFGTLFYILQIFLYSQEPFASISLIEYNIYPWYLGLALSGGALFGDLVKSFFKRRLGIESGKPWIPFDQIDYIIGAVLLSSLIYFPGWFEVAMLVIGGFLFHVMFNHFGYWLGLQKNKW